MYDTNITLARGSSAIVDGIAVTALAKDIQPDERLVVTDKNMKLTLGELRGIVMEVKECSKYDLFYSIVRVDKNERLIIFRRT